MKYEIQVLDEETGYDGFFELKRFRLRHRLYAGGWSEVITRERLERKEAASVLLFDPVQDSLVMIEQFRIGMLERGREAWMLETVGGLIEAGQTPEQVARRETLEEAGCEIQDMVPICEFLVSPGTATERIHLFCARVDASQAGGVFGLPEEGEDIRVEVLPYARARRELCTGRFNSTSVIIAMQWLMLHHDQLRERWLRGLPSLTVS